LTYSEQLILHCSAIKQPPKKGGIILKERSSEAKS
jgi:hypothetical protein